MRFVGTFHIVPFLPFVPAHVVIVPAHFYVLTCVVRILSEEEEEAEVMLQR